MMEENISQKVRDRVTRFKKGDLFTVRDFEDLNNDSLVTRTLSRLQNEGIIVRVATGIYMNPIKTKFGVLHPTIDQIAHKIAERDRAQIMPTGDTALNILGFSTQVPMMPYILPTELSEKCKLAKEILFSKMLFRKTFNSRVSFCH